MEMKSTLHEVLNKVIKGQDLMQSEARDVMEILMNGTATHAQIGALLASLRIKGETVDEITGFAETMRKHAGVVQTEQSDLLDTCGTGGDGSDTFNISTASSIVAAAGGVPVAKHGNRAASSKSGSADVLEALGVNIYIDSKQAAQCLDDIGICFMFAQRYHPSMKHVAAPRKELGIRTVFNLLGPLTNPAGAQNQLLGVFDQNKTELIASVLNKLNVKRAMVVASKDGLDEISISDATKVTELKAGNMETYEINPEMLGLERYSIEEVKGGDAMMNASIIKNIFSGEKGAPREIVLANAGACFYVTNRVSTLEAGVRMAAEVIDKGLALEKLQELIQYTGELSHVS